MAKLLYPNAERLRNARPEPRLDEEPDFIAGKPNYEKYKGWSPEEILAFLNID